MRARDDNDDDTAASASALEVEAVPDDLGRYKLPSHIVIHNPPPTPVGLLPPVVVVRIPSSFRATNEGGDSLVAMSPPSALFAGDVHLPKRRLSPSLMSALRKKKKKVTTHSPASHQNSGHHA